MLVNELLILSLREEVENYKLQVKALREENDFLRKVINVNNEEKFDLCAKIIALKKELEWERKLP